jgi:hypothetical protein
MVATVKMMTVVFNTVALFASRKEVALKSCVDQVSRKT